MTFEHRCLPMVPWHLEAPLIMCPSKGFHSGNCATDNPATLKFSLPWRWCLVPCRLLHKHNHVDGRRSTLWCHHGSCGGSGTATTKIADGQQQQQQQKRRRAPPATRFDVIAEAAEVVEVTPMATVKATASNNLLRSPFGHSNNNDGGGD